MNLQYLKTKLIGWLKLAATISVEPAGFLLLSSVIMTELISQDLLVQRICKVNLSLGTNVCEELIALNGTFKNEEIEVQKAAAEIKTYTPFFSYTLSMFMIVILGPLSDRYGRKLPMLLGTLGYTLEPLLFLLFSQFESVDAWILAIVPRVVKSLSGGELVFFMASYSYLADKTNESTRTMRLGLFYAAHMAGIPTGFSLGGAASKSNWGFVISFGVAASLSFVAFLTILFRVNDVKEVNNNENTEIGKESKDCGRKTVKATKKSIFTEAKVNLLQMWDILFKKRDGGRRTELWALLIVHACVAAPILAETDIMYLFLRDRLQWDAGDYGFFSTYNFCIGVVGNLLSVVVLSHLLKVTDPAVGFLSGISQIAGSLIYAFATNVFLIYLAPTIDMMNGTIEIIAKAMISKKIESDEVGKMFTVIELINGLIHISALPLYTTLYRFTVDIFSGSVFILSASLTIPPLIIYAWFLRKKEPGYQLLSSIEEPSNKNYGSID